MRKNIKKIVAGILSATMLLSTSAIAFADNLTSGGTNSNASKVEGFVDTDVFSVVVPTSVAADTFKFIVDPQQLIIKTHAEAYTNNTEEDFESDATLFFLNSGGTYSHASDKLTVVNKSSMAVNVSLNATITSAGDLTLASSGTFGESDTAAKVYLALKTDGGDTEAITAQGATCDTLLSGAADGAYDYLYSGGTYSYGLTSAANAANYDGFSEMKFYVEGAANPNGDFSKVTEAAPVLDIVWTVTPSASAVEGTAKITPYEGSNYLALKGKDSASFEMEATKVVINDGTKDTDVTAKAILLVGYVAIKASDLDAAGVTLGSGVTLKATYVVDGTTYTASYTIS